MRIHCQQINFLLLYFKKDSKILVFDKKTKRFCEIKGGLSIFHRLIYKTLFTLMFFLKILHLQQKVVHKTTFGQPIICINYDYINV